MDIDPAERREDEGSEGQPPVTPGGRIEFRPETSVQTHIAGVIQADRAELNQGCALAIGANELKVTMGGSWIMAARELNVDRGGAQWLVAGDARIQQGGTGILVARQVDATDVRVGVLLAGTVNGNVQTMLDRDGAMRFGAGLGLVLGMALIIRRLFR